MRIFRTLHFILEHPLNRGRPVQALLRLVGWQLHSRIRAEVKYRWIENSELLVKRGMTGATGNIYCGLHEFPEMGFLIHLLRPGDKFLDVGSNIGSYTILASKVCGARTVAFEPDPLTATAMWRNLILNHIEELVELNVFALGNYNGKIDFTIGLDTTNRVAKRGDIAVRECDVRCLDSVASASNPTLIKMDVEGFEREVVSGGKEILSSPSLLAVQTEFEDEDMRAYFATIGLFPTYYNPFTRTLSNESEFNSSNTIFVRNRGEVMRRLQTAPIRAVSGFNL